MEIQQYSLNDPHTEELTITIKPGTAWALYTDFGPSGPCGQSCDITCPWATLYFSDAGEEFIEWLRRNPPRRGVRSNLITGIVGQFSSGNGSVVLVKKTEEEVQS